LLVLAATLLIVLSKYRKL